MNKRQQLVQQAFLNNEEEVIARLQGIYGESLAGITQKVKGLDSSIAELQKALGSITDDEIGELALAVLRKKNLTPAEAQETIRSMIQSKVYQKQYQEALKKQVGGILDKMGEKQYTTVSDYLQGCYQDGFIGTMYDLQGQGIPLCMPIDQESMVRAVQLDSKISKGLYTRLGEDVTVLKRKIAAQISRGVSSGLTYRQMADQLAGETRIGFNNAVRIARTEGHRIQCQAGMDACYKAQEKGCDVLKQWDATLDGNTRESHSQVDGEIRDLDKPFSNGLMFPGDPSGEAAEVINCRCALLQRASWELDEEELEELKRRAEYFGLDKTASFEEYREKYLRAAESATITEEIVKNPLTKTGKSDTIQSVNGALDTFSRKAQLTDIADDLAQCNPNWGTGEFKWRTNCQRCVPTYELRRRGFNVTAKEQPCQNAWDDILARNPFAVWENPKLMPYARKSDIERAMAEMGDGARVQVRITFRNGDGHTFVAEQRNGKTIFLDPQNNDSDCSRYFADRRRTWGDVFCRIDNLEPSELIEECCS